MDIRAHREPSVVPTAPSPRRSTSGLSRGKLLLFTLTAVALPLILVESVGRLFLHVGHPRFLDEQGREVPSVEAQDGLPYCPRNVKGRLVAGEFDVDVVTDAAGLRVSEDRDPSVTAATASSGPKIELIVVGDSVTFGWGVEFEETFGALLAGRLENELRATFPDVTVNLVNLGCPATGTRSQRLKLERYLSSRATDIPTLVVWTLFLEHGFGGGNDLIDNLNRLKKEQRQQTGATGSGQSKRTHLTEEAQRTVPKPPLYRLKNWLSSYSVLYEIGMRVLGTRLRQFVPRDYSPDQERQLEVAWRALGAEIAAADALVASFHGRVIFGYYPYLQDVASDDSQTFHKLLENTEDSICVVSLLDILADHTESYAFPRDGHPNPLGHSLIADGYETAALREALSLLADRRNGRPES